MNLQATYPTPQHATATEALTRFLTSNYDIDTVVLVNRRMRGKAIGESL